MNVTKRTGMITLVLTAPLLLAGILGLGWFAFIVMNGTFLCVLVIDYLISRKHIRYKLTRVSSTTYSLHAREQMGFEFENRCPYTLKFVLRDEKPDFGLQYHCNYINGQVPAGEEKRFFYEITPKKRGDHKFNKVWVKKTSMLGLLELHDEWHLPFEVQVYPNVKKLSNYKMRLVKSRRFLEAMRPTRLKAKGHSFESLKEYTSGDDYRSINWQATARAMHPIVNEYQLENNQRIYLMLDIGRTMSYTVKGFRKLDLVINTAVVLSDIINQSKDLVGLTSFDHEVATSLVPSKGPMHRKRIVESLYKVEASMSEPNYQQAWLSVLKREKHRSMMILFTDFETLQDVNRFVEASAIVLKKHVVIVLMIEDESIKQHSLNDKESIFVQGTALELMHEKKKIIKKLASHGVFAAMCKPETIEMTAINHYLEAKAKLTGM
ncbi:MULTISPECIES: DUF58 domain-containing protein [unclassified Fusibacter]|uniref:DUF58 domain-containing protein n=1 Tax=unclassified Fusibacter TaxID=2624464 RepID=UPI001011549A|nr:MULTISPECIES: DUF58 domain-containing protein [unclassified Fusibacter]MCK8058637.1 DUF58 domain-containing protein [Fusibacter sp. A2]NPE21712.1 DUF58 domain-containing protein [Fusibacter sp. A1]RXV61287.1 DUF58 domain-containing protein [Fusibacter sp. A1]